jgi:hypothetical protein
MNAENSPHTRQECKYHVVFIPKCPKKALLPSIDLSDNLTVPQKMPILDGMSA